MPEIGAHEGPLKKWVVEYFMGIKKELEVVYKDFIPLVPLDNKQPNSDRFYAVERRLNDAKLRT